MSVGPSVRPGSDKVGDRTIADRRHGPSFVGTDWRKKRKKRKEKREKKKEKRRKEKIKKERKCRKKRPKRMAVAS